MNSDKALDLLGQISARFAEGGDLAQAAAGLVDLALAAHPAKAAFVARSDTEAGLALRWLFGREREGKVLDPQLQARTLLPPAQSPGAARIPDSRALIAASPHHPQSRRYIVRPWSNSPAVESRG